MSDDTPKSASPTPPWQPPLPPLPAPQASEAPRVPGLPRTSYGQPPTAPTPASIMSGPAEVGTDDEPTGWEPAPTPAPHRTGLSGWALLLAALGLVASFFVGWALPLGVIAIILAIVALRRRVESRPAALWALVLGTASVVYSLGWLAWAAFRLGWWS